MECQASTCFFLSLGDSLGESGVFIGGFLVLLFYWRILFLLVTGSVENGVVFER